MSDASIRSRFSVTLVTNLLRALVNFSAGLLVARGLGPEDYGRFAFLIGAFLALRQLLDLGSSNAFFTFVSQRPRHRRFYMYYFAWLAVQSLGPLLVIGLILPASWVAVIWEGEGRALLVLAFAATFLQNRAWQTAVQIAESQRLTHRIQVLNLVVAVFHLVVVTLLWTTGTLTVTRLFLLIFGEYALALVVSAKVVKVATASADSDRLPSMFKDYKKYCGPLVPLAGVGFAYEFADRWLLQHHGGAAEQAYYAVSAQFAAVSLIATTSVLKIFWKEIAEAHERGDKERTANLYRRVHRVFYMVTASIAGFLVPWAEDVVLVVLGPAFVAGATTLAIMFLYPVLQTVGQINGTMLYATEQSRAQAIIGVAFMLCSIVVAYFVLAPPTALVPGMGLGATGLAVKMVGMAVLQVAALTWWTARVNGWPVDWGHHLIGISLPLSAGFLSRWFGELALFGDFPAPMKLVIVATAYLFQLTLGVLLMPWLVDLSRQDVRKFVSTTLGRWRG